MKVILEKNFNNIVVGILNYEKILEQYRVFSFVAYPKDQDICSWLSIKFNYLYEVRNIGPDVLRDYVKNFGAPRNKA